MRPGATLAGPGSHRLLPCGLMSAEPVEPPLVGPHMIEEYARHNGHADLIRELIDGTVSS